jgi:small conductance mechanosensitive channel
VPEWALPGLSIAIILVITFLVVRIYRLVIRRLGRSLPAGLVASIQQIGSWAIWVIGLLIMLSQIQVNTEVLLLIVLLGGVAIILAYRNILTDMAASQFLSSYQAFKIGEWIEVGNNYGRVIERNLLHTKILTPDSEIVIVPNSVMLKRSVVNRSRSGGLRIQVPIFIEKETDLRKVEDGLLEIGRSMKIDLTPDAAPQFRVAEITPEGVKVILMLRISNPAKRDQIISEVEKQSYILLKDLNGQASKPDFQESSSA